MASTTMRHAAQESYEEAVQVGLGLVGMQEADTLDLAGGGAASRMWRGGRLGVRVRGQAELGGLAPLRAGGRGPVVEVQEEAQRQAQIRGRHSQCRRPDSPCLQRTSSKQLITCT